MKRTWMGIVVAAVVVLFGLLLFPTSGYCLDKFFSGSRALGMAGSNVASVNDNSAQYYNPAAFGFFGRCGTGADKKARKGMSLENRLPEDNNNLACKDWRLQAYGGVGVRLHENLPVLLDDLSKIEYKDIGTNSVTSEADLQNLVKLTDILSRLDNEGNAVTADTNGGISFGLGHFAIGAYASLQGNARVTAIDTTNLGIDFQAGLNLNTDINAIVLTGDDGGVSLFSSAQQTQLSTAGYDANAIQQLDFAARQAGLTADQVQGAVDVLADVYTATQASGGTSTLDDNTTSAELRGFGLAEVPLSYGLPLNDNLAFGANVKAMRGRVYAQQVLVFNTESGDILQDADKDYAETTTFGVDLGVLYRINMWQAGLVCRNVNSPKFDGPTVGVRTYDDVTIDPSLTAGLAFIPYEGFTLEVDYDLTKYETVYPGYDMQYLSVGAEWLILRFLALRAGIYDNQAESDIGLVYTAGVGLNIFGVRLDVAGAMAADDAQYDGEDYPVEGRIMAQLSFDF